MEFLKAKKNLPIVAGIAVVVLLIFGGVIAMELGLFSGSPTPAPQVVTRPSSGAPGSPMGGPPGGMPMGRPLAGGSTPGGPMLGGPMPGQPMLGGRPMMPSGRPTMGGASPTLLAAAGVPAKPAVINPAVGPDPFYIPGGQSKVRPTQTLKLPLRDAIGPLNLFQIRPPETQPGPGPVPVTSVDVGTSIYHFIGVVTGSSGINAILDGGGQSLSVKPGDSLPDGSQVQNIQTNSLTLRSGNGTMFTLPLSAGNPDQGAGVPNAQPQFNGQPYINGQPQFPPGNNGQ